MSDYEHSDAFKVVHYRAVDDLDTHEAVWNSRDGIVPRQIILLDGRLAHRAQRHQDFVDPDYHPAVGSRIFIDLTVERAHEIARNQADLVRDEGELKADQIEAITLGGMLQEVERGAADIVLVTQEMAEQRGWVEPVDLSAEVTALRTLGLRDPYGYPLPDEELLTIARWVVAQNPGRDDKIVDRFAVDMLSDELPMVADGYDQPAGDVTIQNIIDTIQEARPS